jgi:hypothetical protein
MPCSSRSGSAGRSRPGSRCCGTAHPPRACRRAGGQPELHLGQHAWCSTLQRHAQRRQRGGHGRAAARHGVGGPGRAAGALAAPAQALGQRGRRAPAQSPRPPAIPVGRAGSCQPARHGGSGARRVVADREQLAAACPVRRRAWHALPGRAIVGFEWVSGSGTSSSAHASPLRAGLQGRPAPAPWAAAHQLRKTADAPAAVESLRHRARRAPQGRRGRRAGQGGAGAAGVAACSVDRALPLGHCCSAASQSCGSRRLAARQQGSPAALRWVLALLGVAVLDGGKTQPQRVARARQRHVEQAQVFAQALLVGLRQMSSSAAGAGVRWPCASGQLAGLCASSRPAGSCRQRAGRPRVLQALALVHGDHLAPGRRRSPGARSARPPLRPPADLHASQRTSACSPSSVRAGLLQQLGQVQQLVSRRSPSVASRSQRAGRSSWCRVWRSMVSTPWVCHTACSCAQLFAARVEGLVVGWPDAPVRPALRPTVRVASAARSQAGVQRRSATARSQCSRSRASSLRNTESLSDRYTEATRAGAVRGARPAASVPVRTSTAMSAGRRRVKALPSACEAGLPGRSARHDLLGAARGKAARCLAGARRPGRGTWSWPARAVASGNARRARGLHGHKRAGFAGCRPAHRGTGRRPRPAGSSACCEPVVDRAHQRLPSSGGWCPAHSGARRGAARGQVAVDVGAAKAVDRLLGVADQQQRGGRVVVRTAVERSKMRYCSGEVS